MEICGVESRAGEILNYYSSLASCYKENWNFFVGVVYSFAQTKVGEKKHNWIIIVVIRDDFNKFAGKWIRSVIFWNYAKGM